MSCDTQEMIKCVVWDLDNTLWDGVLLEQRNVTLKENVPEIIKTLDSRGILQSIASKNNHDDTIQKLDEFGLKDFFLYPQINWNSKAQSIKNISELINIDPKSIAFIDDDPAEIAEVNFSIPETICLEAKSLPTLLKMPSLNPKFVTNDQKIRRQMYLMDIERKEAEDRFVGPKEEFLESLGMTLTIFPAREEDLQRAEELTVRTNQLNATGYTYSYDELNNFHTSRSHKLLMAKLEDRFGNYGHIGIVLVECQQERWIIKLLLMSCRVMTRGIGSIMLSHVMRLAKENGVRLQAEFVPNDRNRMMNITYRFSGFSEVEKFEKMVILENDLSNIAEFPRNIEIIIH